MSTQETQARLLGGPSGESVTINTSGRTIRPALELPSVLVDECKLNLDEDGIHIQAVDPANIAMVDLTITPAAFDDYHVDATGGVTIGVNLSRLRSKLSNARLGKSTDDPIHLDLDETRTVIEIERDYDDTTVRYADEQLNLDPDSIREEPDLPNLDLPATASVDVTAYEDAITHLAADYDHITYRELDGDLVLTTNPHEDSPSDYGSAVAFEDLVDVDADSDQNPISKFSCDYLTDMASGLKDAKVDDVHLRFGEEFPLMMEFERTDDEDTTLYEGTLMLAPRISSGDDI